MRARPITGAPGDTPVGQASEIHWPDFHVLPPRASSIAGQVDTIMGTWLIFSVVVLSAVFGMITVFAIRYRDRGEEAVETLAEKTRSKMEWSWTIFLTLFGLGIGFWADKVFFRMHIPPPGAAPVYVVAKQWMWKFQHDDGSREINELHVPVGEAIQLVMSSEDVIHSFYVPAFRIKQDVLPGRYTYLWFKATVPGQYRLFCAEYCGTSHATMSGKVVVMLPADYEAWKTTHVSGRAGQAGSSLASRGRDLFVSKGCAGCHESQSPDTPGIGPTMRGLYMSQVALSDGRTIVADDNYLRESIMNPNAKVVQGYQSVMPSFQGQLSEEQLQSLIAYMKSLQFYDRGHK